MNLQKRVEKLEEHATAQMPPDPPGPLTYAEASDKLEALATICDYMVKHEDGDPGLTAAAAEMRAVSERGDYAEMYETLATDWAALEDGRRVEDYPCTPSPVEV